MAWTDSWIGIEYENLGRGPKYDCLGLFIELQKKRMGLEIFDPLCSIEYAFRREVAEQNKEKWKPVDSAQEGDALLFTVRGVSLHIGYAVGEKTMLHTSQQIGQSALENFKMNVWGNRLEGIYRYVG